MKARMPAGYGRPDMNALMRQAQKMQEDMKSKQGAPAPGQAISLLPGQAAQALQGRAAPAD